MKSNIISLATMRPLIGVPLFRGMRIQLEGYSYPHAICIRPGNPEQTFWLCAEDCDEPKEWHRVESRMVRPYSEKFGIGWYTDRLERGPVSEERCAFLESTVDTHEAARKEREAQERTAAAERAERGKAWLAANRPEWAVAAIVAEIVVDDSDPQTDYFGEHTTRTVLLGWSKHKRDLFSEMRKAAAGFPETAHLGPNCGHFTARIVLEKDTVVDGYTRYKGSISNYHHKLFNRYEPEIFTTRAEAEAFISQQPTPNPVGVETFVWEIAEENIEHREKYSMGQGYYLQSPGRGGWRVSKETHLTPNSFCGTCGDLANISPALLPKTPVPKQEEPKAETTPAPAATIPAIRQTIHSKKGFPLWVVEITERVSRAEFDRLLCLAKSHGGYWSSYKVDGAIPGFQFKSLADAMKFNESK